MDVSHNMLQTRNGYIYFTIFQTAEPGYVDLSTPVFTLKSLQFYILESFNLIKES